MAEIKIPNQDVGTSSFKGKQGNDVTKVLFTAEYDGKVIACEAFCKKEVIEAARGGMLALEGPPAEEKYGRRLVRIAGQGGGGFGGSKYGGGPQRPWTPQGYRGTPLSADEYWATVMDACLQATQMLKTAGIIFGPKDIPLGAESANLVQDFVAMYMIAIERNVTIVPGHEPKAEATPAAAPAGAGTPVATTAAPQNGVNSVSEYAAQIASATTAGKCDLIKAWVLADTALDDDVKVALQMDLLQRKRALTAAGSA